MSKELYYEDNTVAVHLEREGELLGLHCEVKDWRLSTLKLLYRLLAKIQNENTGAVLMTATLNPRFAELLGGSSAFKLTHEDKEYEVMVWG